jgi:hypothetical protein
VPRSLRSFRHWAALLGSFAAAIAGVVIVVPQASAAGAAPRAAGTGFGPARQIAQPANAAAASDSILIGVACSGRGYCSAGGSYTDSRGNGQAMVVTESAGRWGRAVEVKLPRGAASDPDAEVNGVACTSGGNCEAVGYYQTTSGSDAGFLLSQRRGAWASAQAATPLPGGTTASWLYAVACPATGSCEAVGDAYSHHAGIVAGMVLTQARGRWTKYRALTEPGGGPDLTGIACTRPGACVADGFYYPSSEQTVTRAVGYVESGGNWGAGRMVPEPKNGSGTDAGFTSASCMPRGSCLAAGGYATRSAGYPLAAVESSGKWRASTQIRALPPHATGADLDGVSCASATLCVGAGGYGTRTSDLLGYLVSLVSGRWRDAGGVSLPSNAASPARSFFYAVGCAADGYCAAAGDYRTKSGDYVPMVATRE